MVVRWTPAPARAAVPVCGDGRCGPALPEPAGAARGDRRRDGARHRRDAAALAVLRGPAQVVRRRSACPLRDSARPPLPILLARQLTLTIPTLFRRHTASRRPGATRPRVTQPISERLPAHDTAARLGVAGGDRDGDRDDRVRARPEPAHLGDRQAELAGHLLLGAAPEPDGEVYTHRELSRRGGEEPIAHARQRACDIYLNGAPDSPGHERERRLSTERHGQAGAHPRGRARARHARPVRRPRGRRRASRRRTRSEQPLAYIALVPLTIQATPPADGEFDAAELTRQLLPGDLLRPEEVECSGSAIQSLVLQHRVAALPTTTGVIGLLNLVFGEDE